VKEWRWKVTRTMKAAKESYLAYLTVHGSKVKLVACETDKCLQSSSDQKLKFYSHPTRSMILL
jgi:hypothetical protein